MDGIGGHVTETAAFGFKISMARLPSGAIGKGDRK